MFYYFSFFNIKKYLSGLVYLNSTADYPGNVLESILGEKICIPATNRNIFTVLIISSTIF